MRKHFVSYVKSELGPDSLVITCGLPCTAKSGLAEAVVMFRGYHAVQSDMVRREVLKGEDIFDEEVASDMGRRLKVYDEVFRRAGEELALGHGVVIDATFITQDLRRRAASLAAGHGRTLVIMETECPRDVALARIRRRTRDSYESNAITEQAYINNERRFEKVDIDDLKRLNPSLDIIHLIVDTQYDKHGNWYVNSIDTR